MEMEVFVRGGRHGREHRDLAVGDLARPCTNCSQFAGSGRCCRTTIALDHLCSLVNGSYLIDLSLITLTDTFDEWASGILTFGA